MFSLFIVLLCFSSSLATKCLFLNYEPCKVRPTLIDLSLVELKYYPFMISLNEYTGDCKCSEKTKDINVKAFNMITSKNELKQ